MQEFLFFRENLLSNGWFYISVLEFVVIAILFIRMVSITQKKHNIKKEILSAGNIDYDNIIQSSFNSKPLYDTLKKKCHPDKFMDKESNAIATEIFAKIVENKYNYQALSALKMEAEIKLKIKF